MVSSTSFYNFVLFLDRLGQATGKDHTNDLHERQADTDHADPHNVASDEVPHGRHAAVGVGQ